MIQHNLVKFQASERNNNVAEIEKQAYQLAAKG
jgi:hypothetical protein